MQDGESNGLESAQEKDQIYPASSNSLDDLLCKNTATEEKENFIELVFEGILDELIEDALWEICFDVHRAVKLGRINFEDSKKTNNQINSSKNCEKDIHGQDDASFKKISCPICQKRACAMRFAYHLAKCIGIGDRNSSRTASQKLIALQENDDEDEIDDDSDSSYRSRKRRRETKKKKSKKKPKDRKGNSNSEPFVNYRDMTYEQKESFFNQMCGVVCKRTDKLCKKSLNCSQHTEEMRKDVRHNLLRHMSDQLTNDGQIDVDTVDEGNGELSFFIPTLPNNAASDHNMSSVTSFNEAIPSASNNGLREELE